MDENGSVESFDQVPWIDLHAWLSELNGNPNVSECLVGGVNSGKVIEELEARRTADNESLIEFDVPELRGIRQLLYGHGQDWRDYENPQGYTHFEELLIYQPRDWRKQAREYVLEFECDVSRESRSRAGSVDPWYFLVSSLIDTWVIACQTH